MARVALFLVLLTAVFASAAAAREEVVPASAGSDWRSAATQHDRGRLRHWRDAWADALLRSAAAPMPRRSRAAARCSSPTPLCPARAAARRLSLRTVKLGRAAAATRDHVAYPAVPCRSFARGRPAAFHDLAGAQRRAGTIFPDNAGV